MRLLESTIPLLVVGSVFLAVAQTGTVQSSEPDRAITIPVELTNTIRADKESSGGEVRFAVVEPILIGHAVVIPAETRIYGRILATGSKQGSSPSWIKLVLERVEWKDHLLQTRGFISSQIRQLTEQRSRPGGIWEYKLTGDRRGKRVRRAESSPTLQGVKVFRDKIGGVTYLLSDKTNLKIVSGSLFNVQIELLSEEQSASGRPDTAPQPQGGAGTDSTSVNSHTQSKPAAKTD